MISMAIHGDNSGIEEYTVGFGVGVGVGSAAITGLVKLYGAISGYLSSVVVLITVGTYGVSHMPELPIWDALGYLLV